MREAYTGKMVMDGVTLSICAKCRYYFDEKFVLDHMQRPDGVRVAPEHQYDWQLWNFPLWVKKGWRVTGARLESDGRPAAAHIQLEFTMTVEGIESVRVSAGTFRAFRIRRDIHWNVPAYATANAEGRIIQTIWFSPETKWIVKQESTDPRDKNWELVSYRIK